MSTNSKSKRGELQTSDDMLLAACRLEDAAGVSAFTRAGGSQMRNG
jgi:hypothetical protein